MIKKAIKILILLILVLNIDGCWSRRELDTLALVLGVAIDRSEQENKIDLTLQVANPKEENDKGSGGGAGESSDYLNLLQTADTISQAYHNMVETSSRIPYNSHKEVMLFHYDLAKEGIEEYIDYFLRDVGSRLNTWLVITRPKGSEVLENKFELEPVPALYISKMMVTQNKDSIAVACNIYDFIKGLDSNGIAVVPILNIVDDGKRKKTIIDGTAVFKGYKMIGELDKEQTTGMQWVKNKISGGLISIETDGGIVDFEIMGAKTKVSCRKDPEGNFVFNVHVIEESGLNAQNVPIDTTKPDTIIMLQNKKKEDIKKKIMDSLSAAKELNVDVFGFGELIASKYKKDWQKLKDGWPHNFEGIKVDLKVDAFIRNVGGLSKPVKQKDGSNER
ncbi:MAG TPA: Ger(x)C family spore germination protein [Clostridia bacterium]|mgnify:CR=1 FL=1|nr:Ger(x)C family spore germination protein [Clostridia bacterium]